MTAQLLQLEAAPDLVDQVYRALLDAISAGALAPGQRITQEELAERLAVSRQPVMQALRLLKRDGFVQDAPGRGLVVTPLDPALVRDVYAVRGALDALAARLAAERGARLDEGLLTRGRAAAQGGDINAMVEADLDFHHAIYAAAGNPFIGQTAQPHWQHLRRAMGAVLAHQPQRASIWDEHQAIAQAIAQGDAEQAARLSEQHARQAGQALAARLDELLNVSTPSPGQPISHPQGAIAP